MFIQSGAVGVGYQLFNEKFFGVQIVMTKTKKTIVPINDYNCLKQRGSQFLYKAINNVEGYAIRNENFLSLLNTKINRNMR